MTFLSKAERNYLTGAANQEQFNDGYSRVIKSRLQKKVEFFVNQELPLLIENEYLVDVTEFRNVTENCNASEHKRATFTRLCKA
jgi:hypothetical protein